ncbi:MAG: hypothetical protein UT34_C0001G0046 [candidate division WS6 bacterium GW2011_GWF2_39_15]|uniref:Acyltransferase 3 domain-containing protein n=1 Tax=candidate division WS6 bacterium GW2011_GWF2_39_15 TaxID=1619100 RepID=A0A0G0MZH4_9BACT|nr:MAG: hypothetical protein UT34_C0001G0046 [candidate division WS6 bacterium GW2011_GWF2_39_15]
MNLDRRYYPEVDKLKAFATIIVILTHILAEHKGGAPYLNLIWELIHFSVGIFVFVSGFLHATSKDVPITYQDIWRSIAKRVIRIVKPYYLYVLLFIVAMAIMGRFGELIQKADWKYVFNTVFLLGGVGYAWIPRLFLSLYIVIISLQLLSRVRAFKYIIIAFLILSMIFSAITQFVEIDFLSKFNFVFGWFIIYIAGFFLQKFYKHINVTWVFAISSIGTLILLGILLLFGLNTSLFHNEYPPTPYFILYNLAVIALLWMIATKVNLLGVVHSAVEWLSRHAYEMFLYHLLFLYIIFRSVRINIVVDFFLVLFSTVLLIVGMEKIQEALKRRLPLKSF